MQFSALLGNEVKIERMENISHPGRLIWAQVREVYSCWRMKRFDSMKRGNGVGREPIKYQPILVWETLQQFLNKV